MEQTDQTAEVPDAYAHLFSLLTDMPEGVDLTLVGGSALAHYVREYRNVYPEDFGEGRSAATKDLDFVGQREEAERCAAHWGCKLIVPSPGDSTPEVAILEIVHGDFTFQIDFLHDLIGIQRQRVISSRAPFDSDGRIFLLSEAMVLTNRVMNIVHLNKADRHSLDQLHLAKTVVTCAIKAAIDTGRPKYASRIAHTVLKLARHRDGINFSHQHGISLVDCVPLGRGLPAEFEQYTLSNLTSQVEQKLASRRQRDTERASLTT